MNYPTIDDNTTKVEPSTTEVLFVPWKLNVTVYCCVASSKVHVISVTSSSPKPALAKAELMACC